jgi:hypothetical protein
MLGLRLGKYKNQIKYVGIGILCLVAMYWMIYLFTPKPQMPVNIKATIDSLTKINTNLVVKQNQLDSAILSYQKQIFDLDYAISNIKEKTIIIKEHYHEVSQTASKFTPSQVDSFFKSRYKY